MIRSVSKRLCHIVKNVMLSRERTYGTAQMAPLQEAAMKERCILLDMSDRSIGEATKEACHEVKEGSLPLHRAFSVFLFNDKGELLLHKRASSKVTFPDHYTNTCCSHPLAEIPEETEEKDAIGVRRAAIRRLNYELGIPTNEIKLSELFYLTRIYYKAVNTGRWGEHEIDYILFLRKNNLTIDPNPDEISEIRWVSRSEIDNFVNSVSLMSPWFRLIYQHKLLHWWDNLHDLSKVQDRDNIIPLTF